MSEIRVSDEGGDVMTMVDFGDFRSSLFGTTVDYIREVNVQLHQFQFRDDDILILSYPKTGCTWTFEVLTMLLTGTTDKIIPSKMDTMLEARVAKEIDAVSSPRLLNSHLPYRRLPQSLKEKKVKIVFVVRNPKDAAVSLYHMMTGMTHYHYEGKFHNWLPLYIRGDLAYDSYWRYLKDYEAIYKSGQHRMFLLHYEDLKKDTVGEIARLSEFLGLSPNPGLVEEIAAKCQFNVMRTRYNEASLGGSSYKSGKNYGFMRKGEVGDWKNWFTVAQSELIDSIVGDELKGSDIKFTYQL